MVLMFDALPNSWSPQDWVMGPLRVWLATHPVVAWLVDHPLVTLGLGGIAVLLLAGLWSAIARLTEGFWLTLVRLPFQLVAWGFGGMVALLLRRRGRRQSLSPDADRHDRLSQILQRLETLQTEQATLHQELQLLLGQHPRSTMAPPLGSPSSSDGSDSSLS